MGRLAGRIGLGLALIAILSAVLLFSDWTRRSTAARLPRVAFLQFSSHAAVDETAKGFLDAFRDKGHEDKRSILLERFNAHGDLPTLNTIARSIAEGGFDLVVSVTTPGLQAMANANRERRIRHVFGGVTDPFISGVGLKRENRMDHPPYMTGFGTFQPVRQTFVLGKKLYPGLRVAGTIWNPAEACSQACVKVARAAARELGMELLEAQAESSSAVLEAANSLVARGVQAFFVGGDNTVEVASQSVLKAAAQGNIPVLAYEAKWVERGALLGLGADYYQVGREIGELAGDVLNGRDPAGIPIGDVAPDRLGVNLAVPARLRDPWRVPAEIRAAAAVGVDEKGVPWNRSIPKQP